MGNPDSPAWMSGLGGKGSHGFGIRDGMSWIGCFTPYFQHGVVIVALKQTLPLTHPRRHTTLPMHTIFLPPTSTWKETKNCPTTGHYDLLHGGRGFDPVRGAFIWNAVTFRWHSIQPKPNPNHLTMKARCFIGVVVQSCFPWSVLLFDPTGGKLRALLQQRLL